MFVPEPGRRSACCAAVAVLALLWCASPQPVEGHALLRHSIPEDGAALERAPEAMFLVFTEPPEPTLSSIHVLDSAGRFVEAGRAQPVPGRPVELRVPLQGLPAGVYTVTWRTVSRIDGHVAGGALNFGVGVAPAGPPPQRATNPLPSALYVVSRLLVYVGLIGLLATALTYAAGSPPSGRWSDVWILWAAAAVGLILLGVAQAQDAGAGMHRLLQTPLGHALWWRGVPLAAAAVATAAGGRGRGSRRRAAALGVMVAATMLAQVVAGHAAAETGPRRVWNIAVQWVHFAGVGAWAGALATILLTVRTAPPDRSAGPVRLLSLAAAIGLGAVGVTGALRAVDEIGTWSAVLTTSFGRLVLAKAGLFTVLALLGALSRSFALLRAPNKVRVLSWAVGTEMAVAAGALAVTAVMTGLAPPATTREAAAAAPGIFATGNDYATSVRVRLSVAPGRPGINRFTAAISDYDSGRPVLADRVTLRFTKPDRADIGPSSLPLPPLSAGLYTAEGSNISLDGRWSVVAVVERGNGSVEVPLELPIGRASPAVRTVRAPGKPPVYVLDLSGGRTLSLYLDPGKAGFNALHGTFVDAQGRELSLAAPPEVTAGRVSGPRRALPVLREGPGHFSTDADLGTGAWQLVIVATTRTGETLRAQLTLYL